MAVRIRRIPSCARSYARSCTASSEGVLAASRDSGVPGHVTGVGAAGAAGAWLSVKDLRSTGAPARKETIPHQAREP